jgi:hypothetical protein
VQEQLENFVSYQGAEIRKFILENIKDYVRIQNLDPVELQKTITSIKTLIDSNLSSVKSIVDLVEGNKNAIDRAKQELKDLILSSNTDLGNSLRAELNTKIDSVNTTLQNQLTSVKQELLFRQSINSDMLVNVFAKSLWNYTDYICTKDVVVGTGTNTYRFKLSGDHFNPNAIAYDNGIGSPEVSICINGKELYRDKVLAIKILNQYEYITIKTNDLLKDFSVTFITDAWEGGSDRNLDGMSEDRNLYVFEVTENSVALDKSKFALGGTIGAFKDVMYGQGTLSYKR